MTKFTVEITDKANHVVAAPGETCKRVDPKALDWLLRCQAIELIAPKDEEA